MSTSDFRNLTKDIQSQLHLFENETDATNDEATIPRQLPNFLYKTSVKFFEEPSCRTLNQSWILLTRLFMMTMVYSEYYRRDNVALSKISLMFHRFHLKVIKSLLDS